MSVISYIGLGSNLGDSRHLLDQAIAELDLLPQTHVLQQSSMYRTKPWGPQNQPDFFNAVVEITTELEPFTLLTHAQDIEKRMGRVPAEHWGPRVIDLDILLYGDLCLETEHLTVPHLRLMEREFVLYPLAEIAPDLILPNGQSILELKYNCDPRGIMQL